RVLYAFRDRLAAQVYIFHVGGGVVLMGDAGHLDACVDRRAQYPPPLLTSAIAAALKYVRSNSYTRSDVPSYPASTQRHYRGRARTTPPSVAPVFRCRLRR